MNRKRGYILIVVTALIFSTTEVALKLLTGKLAPMQITAERVAIGGLVLLPFALRYLRAEKIRLNKEDWLYFICVGFVSVAVQMVFLQWAVMEIDASAAAVLYSGSPIISIFAAHFVVHEPIRKNHVLALSLMLIGILVILDPLNLDMSLSGFAKIMIATISYGFYSVLCKLRLDHFNSVTITSFALLTGDALMFFLLLLGRTQAVAGLYSRIGLDIFVNVPLVEGFTVQTVLALFYVGACVAGFGLFLTAQITRDTSATEASFVYLLKPIFATVIAVAVLHETIGLNRKIGIIFFMAASLCVSIPMLRDMRREKKEKLTE